MHSSLANITRHHHCCNEPQSGVDATSRTQSSAFPVVLRPPMMPQPAQKAMHNKPHTIVGSTMIRSNLMRYVPAKKRRGKDSTKRGKRKCNKCKVLKMYDSDLGHRCAALGRGRECDYFDENNKRRCWRCWKLGSGDLVAYTCPATRGSRDDCAYFVCTGNRKYKKKI